MLSILIDNAAANEQLTANIIIHQIVHNTARITGIGKTTIKRYLSCLVISCPAFSCPAILMVRHFQRPHPCPSSCHIGSGARGAKHGWDVILETRNFRPIWTIGLLAIYWIGNRQGV